MAAESGNQSSIQHIQIRGWLLMDGVAIDSARLSERSFHLSDDLIWLVAEANRNAGLDGWLKFSLSGNDEYVAMDCLGELTEDDWIRLKTTTLDLCVYGPECAQGHRLALGSALLAATSTGLHAFSEEYPGEDSDGKTDEKCIRNFVARQVRGLLDQGFFSIVSAEVWEEESDGYGWGFYPQLLYFAVLTEPRHASVHKSEGDEFGSLCAFGGGREKLSGSECDVHPSEKIDLRSFGPAHHANQSNLPKTRGHARRSAIAPGRLTELSRRFERARFDWDLFEASAPASEKIAAGLVQEWVVEGLIPRGEVTAVIGAREQGKSTMMLDLAVQVDLAASGKSGKRTWLDRPVLARPGSAAVLFSGEDGPANTASIQKRLDTTDSAEPFILPKILEQGLESQLSGLVDAGLSPIDLVIVDSSRSFLVGGSETNDEAVSEFLETLRAFAVSQNCAVIVLHHVNRTKKPRKPVDVLEAYSGSHVWLDRPRNVIGIVSKRSGAEWTSLVACVKGNLAGRDRSVIELVADPDTMRLSEIEPHDDTQTEDANDSTGRHDEFIISSISHAEETGKKTTRTGPNSLYERSDPNLSDLSRRALAARIERLIRAGRLRVDKGCLSIPAANRA